MEGKKYERYKVMLRSCKIMFLAAHTKVQDGFLKELRTRAEIFRMEVKIVIDV